MEVVVIKFVVPSFGTILKNLVKNWKNKKLEKKLKLSRPRLN